jgi:hypothetical protein
VGTVAQVGSHSVAHALERIAEQKWAVWATGRCFGVGVHEGTIGNPRDANGPARGDNRRKELGIRAVNCRGSYDRVSRRMV